MRKHGICVESAGASGTARQGRLETFMKNKHRIFFEKETSAGKSFGTSLEIKTGCECQHPMLNIPAGPTGHPSVGR